MRVFYLAGDSPNSYHIAHSTIWRRNLHDALVDMGHDVVSFPGDINAHFTRTCGDLSSADAQREFAAFRTALQPQIVDAVAAAHRECPIDIMFSYVWAEICDAATIDTIRSLGITTVNWFCNASYQFHLIRDLAPHFDWCLVPERDRLEDYRAVGARPIYCQEAANPRFYRPLDLPQDIDVSFAGQAYGDRESLVRHLLRGGICVRTTGWGWERVTQRLFDDRPDADAATVWEGIVSDEELVRFFNRSRISLGFSSCGNTYRDAKRIVQIRLRDFEVPMSGGFYLVEYMPELEQFFRIGREIVCYHDRHDLLDKVRFYLAHDRERERIRWAGCERARRDHTWQRRLSAAFSEMGLR